MTRRFFILLFALIFLALVLCIVVSAQDSVKTKASQEEINAFRVLYKAEDPPKDGIDESLVCIHALEQVIKEGYESIDYDVCTVCGASIKIVVTKNKYGLKSNQILLIDTLLDEGHIPKSWDIKSDIELEIRFHYYKTGKSFVFKQDNTWQESANKFKTDKELNK